MWDGEKCALGVASDAKFCEACGVKLEEHAEPKRSKASSAAGMNASE